MKKFFQSKGFIVSSLALLCVSILGVCWFVSRDRTGDFRPDESPPAASPAIGQMAAHRQMVIMEQMLMPPASPQTPKKNIPK